jgi:hypothetical protein
VTTVFLFIEAPGSSCAARALMAKQDDGRRTAVRDCA